jgi:putative ABC transport system permease protein
LALTLGSAIFIAVLSVYAGMMTTLNEALDYYGFDLMVSFSRPYRIEQIETELRDVPGIVSAENWGFTSTRIVNDDGSETNTIIFVAPPPDTKLINPVVLAGRWLLPEDNQAVVINTEVLREAPDVRVGDNITLNIRGTSRTWHVVGIVRSVMTGPMMYTNYPYFSQINGRYGLASSIYLATEKHDLAYQEEMAKTLESHFERVGINVASTNNVSELRATAINQFNVIFMFLFMMAILLTIVGAFGLAGTMSLNVLERTREIGIMRAIGASNGAVMQIVIVEGILMGLISWFFGSILAYPLGILLSKIMGQGFLGSPITYTYSIAGAMLWLFVVVVLGFIASLLPAQKATRVPVRDVLAYE